MLDEIDQLQAKPVYRLTIDNVSTLILKSFSQTQIAKILRVSKQAVNQFINNHADTLRPLIDNTDSILAQRFKREAIESLDSIDTILREKASYSQRIIGSAIATEKYRLLADKSTGNVSVMITDSERENLQSIAAEAGRKAIQEQAKLEGRIEVETQDIVIPQDVVVADNEG